MIIPFFLSNLNMGAGGGVTPTEPSYPDPWAAVSRPNNACDPWAATSRAVDAPNPWAAAIKRSAR